MFLDVSTFLATATQLLSDGFSPGYQGPACGLSVSCYLWEINSFCLISAHEEVEYDQSQARGEAFSLLLMGF